MRVISRDEWCDECRWVVGVTRDNDSLDMSYLEAQIKSKHRLVLTSFYSLSSLRETHEIAQAQQQKNARLREAFGISDYFVEGTSFDPERKAREDLAKSEALQKEIQAEKDTDKANRKKYALVRTPSPDKSDSAVAEDDDSAKAKVDKKKKKKRNRDVWVLWWELMRVSDSLEDPWMTLRSWRFLLTPYIA